MKRTTPSISYYQVLEASSQPGCPICGIAERTVDRYLSGLLWEQVNDPGTREQLRRTQGFCNAHAWRLPRVQAGAPLGIAIIYRDLISRVAEQIEAATFASLSRLSFHQVQETLDRDQPAAATAAVVQSLQPRSECPACAQRDRSTTIALHAMLDALPDDQRLLDALKASAGLCLPHLRRAFELTRDERAFAVLQAIMQEKIAALLADLDEFIRKNDYRFINDGFGSEADSWRHAIAWMVGVQGVLGG